MTAFGAAGTASALPEVGRCVAQPGTGKYKNSNCRETSEKHFEFKKGAKSETEGVHFTSAGGASVLESELGEAVRCQRQIETGKYDEDSGVIKEVEGVVISLEGCEVLGVACQSKGGTAGVITTNRLVGPLGYISGEKTTKPAVGQELTPELKKGCSPSLNAAAPTWSD